MMLGHYDKPLPADDPDAKPFWQRAREHRLAVQRCDDCGDRHFPPGPVCPACLSERQSWEDVSGRARLLSWVVFHRAYWVSFRDDVPYDACLVQLEEGPILVSNFGAGIPPDVRAGMPLRVVFDDVSSELTLPRFVPA